MFAKAHRSRRLKAARVFRASRRGRRYGLSPLSGAFSYSTFRRQVLMRAARAMSMPARFGLSTIAAVTAACVDCEPYVPGTSLPSISFSFGDVDPRRDATPGEESSP